MSLRIIRLLPEQIWGATADLRELSSADHIHVFLFDAFHIYMYLFEANTEQRWCLITMQLFPPSQAVRTAAYRANLRSFWKQLALLLGAIFSRRYINIRLLEFCDFISSSE